MTVREILLLGNPKLHEISRPITRDELDSIPSIIEDLHDTLMSFREKYGAGRAIAAPQIGEIFREKYGAGRAIAAPQIGEMKKIVYMHIDQPTILINPEISNKSTEMMELWDDCMSFPDLYVKVKRHKTCQIEYLDIDWNRKSQQLQGDLSELLQHECDHLEGVLAVSRAIDGESFALSNQKHHFHPQ
ncbi:MAG: peptide deformylase [Candidatus Thorarchaeota archaeon]|jgi:peptide deformylase